MSNLIEQLGGYECAKAEYDDPMYEDGELYTIKATGTRFFKHNLAEELLEYRRQHNIFEVGDKVVILTLAIGNKYPWKVDSIDGCMIEISQIGQPNEWVHFSEIVHATDEEIEAGHRL